MRLLYSLVLNVHIYQSADLSCPLDAGPLVHHFDLYRLSGPAELGRLQLEDAFNSGICLIEWAERLGSCAPADHLQIHIELLSEVCNCLHH